jgi:hypothetical protein
MSRSNNWVNIILAASILVYLSVWLLGIYKHRVLIYLSVLNAVGALALIVCWVQNEVWSTKQNIEGRERAFVCVELIVIILSICTLLSSRVYSWLKITQYIIFALHLTGLLLFFIFMLTFKMNRLI